MHRYKGTVANSENNFHTGNTLVILKTFYEICTTTQIRTIIIKMKPFDMTRAGIAEAAKAEQRAYLFWLTLILLCHLLQVFVGANIRPPRHMLPNAP